MRRLIPAVVLMLAAGLAVAQDPPRPSDQPGQPGTPGQQPGAQPGYSSMGKKEMTAIVVSADPTVKTITVRKEGASSSTAQETLTVAGAAVSRLSSIKAGDKVKLTLTTDPTTSKESVTSIEKDDKDKTSNP
ncbi:MAG TPA: hypothetical protein VLL75_17885 [Vicinamibacteria bacterium]|nr:hypothetical protein [Vicinamibacteria bacterium]